jgi:hypothetical protein
LHFSKEIIVVLGFRLFGSVLLLGLVVIAGTSLAIDANEPGHGPVRVATRPDQSVFDLPAAPAPWINRSTDWDHDVVLAGFDEDEDATDGPSLGASDPGSTKKSDRNDDEPPPVPPKSVREPSNDPPPAPPDTPGSTELTPQLEALRRKIRKTLAIYHKRHLNSRDHSPWEVMHGFIAYNVHTKLRREGPDGEAVNCVGWMLWGGRCRNQMMLTLRNGRPHAEEGVGVQGHAGQFMAILAQSRVSSRTPMRIEGKEFTLQDLIEEEKLDCRSGTELTFKLIGLTHYLPTDTVWKSRDGQSWSIPRLIQEEIKSPIRGAACGGTHRLYALTYAFKTREKRGEPVEDEYRQAKDYIRQYHRYTWTLQNSDGSLSTAWFARRENRADIDRKIQTTGHMTEWLVFSLEDDELRSPRMIKSIDFLASTLLGAPQRDWSIGPLGHTLHALVMYDERVFRPAEAVEEVASRRDRLATKPQPADETNEKSESDANATDAAGDTDSNVTPETQKATQESSDDAESPQD